ncbi:hypothetical protein DSM106972_092900 [Dulcicalothrix desertica PCC 7102]|uniref:Uncharacterized protein n=1 Tax=Dulcicalothrix desertica PCC 7102 TaxID=232991 RepID=A0A433ULB0_9CYAN|nr:hypothetical protein [Dulcicalothrix desertica]RUS94653.1 hypothetical protein DSM106972_092900 [Dulcicalothrix desertica PCC 7102]TWH62547.1 hypothetical protein CAL7102_00038 [Dulcicalothrix desertica PCC 7102]
MSQENFLYDVIRKVERAEAVARAKNNYSTGKVVVVDKRTGETQAKIPTISFGGNLVYYIVSNDSSIFSEPRELRIEITDFSNNRTLGISVTYRASCEADKNNNEEKVAKALHSDTSPEAELDKKIRRWVIEFTRDRVADFIDNYFDEIKKLQNNLQTKARNEAGLRLDLRISPIQTQDARNLVFSNKDASNIAERSGLIIEVEDVASSRQLSITLAYRASYDPIDREKVAQQLFTTGKPIRDEIDKKIKYWVNYHLRGREGEFIDQYSGKVTALKQYLQITAREEIGIQLDLNISLTKQVETIVIPPSEITVRVSDSDEALDLTIQTELLVLDRIKAISHSNRWGTIQLTNLLNTEIKNYLQLHTKISDFYYELKDKVRNGLVDYLNQKLADKGRIISYLYLDSKVANSSPPPKELVEIQHTVECKVQNYSRPIRVENTLQMLPQDVRRYISAQSPNLQAWVESKLEKIIKPLLLTKKYIDILDDFQKDSQKIREAMEREAASIGYAVEHIVSLPRIEHLRLKENFEILDENQQFSTNTASIKVKLSTSINAKFKNFNKIEDYLNGNVSQIIEEMRKVVNSTTREVLRRIEPERFYMRFYVAETHVEKSVEQELKETIEATLKERFGAEIISIVPIPEQTEIIDYLQTLMGMIGSFECSITPLSGGEVVNFKGDFKILGIETGSWYRFQSVFQSMQQSQQQLRQKLKALKEQYSKLIKAGDIEDNSEELEEISEEISKIESQTSGISEIKNSIEKSINSKLMNAGSELLRYTDIQLLSTMERYINEWARGSVIDQYGLEISIRNLSRTRTEQETYVFKAQQTLEKAKVDEALAQIQARTELRKKQLEMSSRRNQAKSVELDKLYERKAKLIADPDAEADELQNLEAKINRLEQELLNPSLEDAESSLQLLEPNKNKGRNSLLFEEQMNLPPSQSNSDS